MAAFVSVSLPLPPLLLLTIRTNTTVVKGGGEKMEWEAEML